MSSPDCLRAADLAVDGGARVPAFRVDHIPYGGATVSGFGREGVRHAFEKMTALKLVTYNRRT